MKKKVILIVLIVTVGLFVYFQLTNGRVGESPLNDSHRGDSDHASHSSNDDKSKLSKKYTKDRTTSFDGSKASSSSSDIKGKTPFVAESNEEKELLSFHKELQVIYNSDEAMERISEVLTEKDMEPKKAVDSNPYTGTMTTIRSQKAKDGTRYHHAQFFTDEDGKSFLQHYSMEYRPGPNAFDRVRAMVESSYGVSNGELSADGTFVNYQLKDGYILWVKKMGVEDLAGDPFNAYSKEDVGTIRMAIEQEIHDHQDNDHLEPPEAPRP